MLSIGLLGFIVWSQLINFFDGYDGAPPFYDKVMAPLKFTISGEVKKLNTFYVKILVLSTVYYPLKADNSSFLRDQM